MTFKRIVNLVLLVFVAISIFTLIYKESGKSKESSQAEKKEAASSIPKPVLQLEIKNEESQKPPVPPNSAEPMKEKSKTENKKSKSEEKNDAPQKIAASENRSEEKPESKEEEKKEKIIVYYFMTTTRCPSCYKIENYTHSCILDKFPNEIASGKMEWKMVNVDEKENAHFIKDYELFTKSVVLSKQVDGKEVKWKKLDKVWDLLYDQNEFYKYIEEETENFIGDKN
jgi:hypothetical protein